MIAAFDCRGYITPSVRVIFKLSGENNHNPDNAPIRSRTLKNGQKKRSLETQEELTKLWTMVHMACLHVIGEACMNMKKLMQRHQQKNKAAPPVPKSLSELIIPDSYKGYEEEMFLQHDSGPRPDRVLVTLVQKYTTTERLESYLKRVAYTFKLQL